MPLKPNIQKQPVTWPASEKELRETSRSAGLDVKHIRLAAGRPPAAENSRQVAGKIYDKTQTEGTRFAVKCDRTAAGKAARQSTIAIYSKRGKTECKTMQEGQGFSGRTRQSSGLLHARHHVTELESVSENDSVRCQTDVWAREREREWDLVTGALPWILEFNMAIKRGTLFYINSLQNDDSKYIQIHLALLQTAFFGFEATWP